MLEVRVDRGGWGREIKRVVMNLESEVRLFSGGGIFS